MSKKYHKAVCDTSCLILLDKIDHLWILKELFADVFITPSVKTEFLHYKSVNREKIADLTIISPKQHIITGLKKYDIGTGENSVMATAKTEEKCWAIMDDLKARKIASEEHVSIIGTLGLFPIAKKAEILNSVESLLLKVKKTDFRISLELEIEILKLAGEL